MANIMDEVRLRNKPSRNGFDLSFKSNFTSKVGEILPVFCKPVFPGDKFRITVKSFTRLQPINTAAFARMREYIDFYFVPMEQLWNRWDTIASQTKDNLMHAYSSDVDDNVAPSGDLPYITSEQIADYLQDSIKADLTNEVGYKRALCSAKLLEYLGYGRYYDYCNQNDYSWSANPKVKNLRYSILPLLAYQKVYYDHFRFSQWEKTNPSCFNVDYLSGVDDLNFDLSKPNFQKFTNFLDLRYCNFNKDLFLGVLPNAQYGETAAIDTTNAGDFIPLNITGLSDGVPIEAGNLRTITSASRPKTAGVVGGGTIGLPVAFDVKELAGKFSILQLRQAEALQKYKEITQSVSEDYKAQIEAHFGVKVSDYLSHISKYLGGIAANMDINSVVNTNITGDNQADLAGVGTVQNNGVIDFDATGQYGYIIGVYHAVPLFDYCCDGVDPITTQSHFLDFPIPEFDQIGMELVPFYKLCNPIVPTGSSSDEYYASEFAKANDYLGYAPRYVDWKTSVDVARGAFSSTLKNWIVPFDFNRLKDYYVAATGADVTYIPATAHKSRMSRPKFRNPSSMISMLRWSGSMQSSITSPWLVSNTKQPTTSSPIKDS